MSTPALPIIDISPFLTPTPDPAARAHTLETLRSALHTHGFFYLTSHSLPSSLTTRVLALARDFFLTASPAEKAAIGRRGAGALPTTAHVDAATGLPVVPAESTPTTAESVSTNGSHTADTKPKSDTRTVEVALPAGDGARGYQRIGSNVTQGRRDWHEAVDWYAEMPGTCTSTSTSTPSSSSSSSSPPYALLHGPNLWPRVSSLDPKDPGSDPDPDAFRNTYTAYVAACRDLGSAVLRAMGEALGLRDAETWVRAVEESFWVMRAIGYPPREGQQGQQGQGSNGKGNGEEGDGDVGVGCGAHTDYGCLTLLLDDGTKGALQVWRWGKARNGLENGENTGAENDYSEKVDGEDEDGQWLPIDPLPGALVVNVGDMIERWTGGAVRSTRHRVVHTGANFRVSVPFFLEPGRDVVVQCLEEFREGMQARIRSGEVGEGVGAPVRYWEHLVGKIGGNFAEEEEGHG